MLYIETALVYNPVRAMIRTINPKEDKLLEGETKFKKKVYACHVMVMCDMHDVLSLGADEQY